MRMRVTEVRINETQVSMITRRVIRAHNCCTSDGDEDEKCDGIYGCLLYRNNTVTVYIYHTRTHK